MKPNAALGSNVVFDVGLRVAQPNLRVRERLAPLVTGDAAAWLELRTQSI
jgi:hypothetical protein